MHKLTHVTKVVLSFAEKFHQVDIDISKHSNLLLLRAFVKFNPWTWIKVLLDLLFNGFSLYVDAEIVQVHTVDVIVIYFGVEFHGLNLG